MSTRSLRYHVSTPNPRDHYVHVRATFSAERLPEPLVVAIPAWTPGSYLVREYARHVDGLRASGDGLAAGVRKVRKDAWAVAHGNAREVTVTYRVYARELTVRTCYVDDRLAWLNGAALFVRPEGDDGAWDEAPVSLELELAGEVVTSLRRDDGGAWRAASYHELVDSPVAAGRPELRRFTAAGREHTLAVFGAGLSRRYDGERFARDVATVVEAEAGFFGSLPHAGYTFLVQLAPGGRGGLEHASSCAVMASPDAFETEEGYHELLSLVAHEYLHLWHVKRTRPEGLARIDYARENLTRALWLFEGGTSYYDWRFLRRARIVTPRHYLRHLAAEVAAVEDTPGRFEQTLEEASLDAWIRHYRADEHTANSTVSYYRKGELACAVMDLELRARSGGRASLDDVFRHLWTAMGSVGRPVPEERFEALVAAATDVDLSDVVDRCLRTTAPLPLEEALSHAGLGLRVKVGRGASLGVRLRVDDGRVRVASVTTGGAAALAGVCPGDEIIGFCGRRVDENALRERLRHDPGLVGARVPLLVARRDELMELEVSPAAAPPESYEIFPRDDASPAQRMLAESWLECASSALWHGEPGR